MSNEPAPSAVVCLPGLLGDARVFEPLFDVLESEREITGIDLPPGSFSDAAAVISAKLSERWDQPVDLVTGSFGGLVALSLPRANVRSIATVGTMPNNRFFPTAMARMLRGIQSMPSSWVERLYRQHLARSLERDGVPANIRTAIAQRTIRKRVLIDRLRSIQRENPAGLDVPLLWLTGSEDGQTRWSSSEVLAAYPQAIIDSVPGAHRPYASHPEHLADRLRQFWSERA